jgi:hypothetical protein
MFGLEFWIPHFTVTCDTFKLFSTQDFLLINSWEFISNAVCFVSKSTDSGSCHFGENTQHLKQQVSRQECCVSCQGRNKTKCEAQPLQTQPPALCCARTLASQLSGRPPSSEHSEQNASVKRHLEKLLKNSDAFLFTLSIFFPKGNL